MRVALEPRLAETRQRAEAPSRDRGVEFGSALAGATERLDAQLRAADGLAVQAAHEKVDVHEAALALERADIELRLMVKVRNKVVDAYREIMRLSV